MERGGDIGSDVTFVVDGVVMAEEFIQVGGVHGLHVVGFLGQWTTDVHQVPEKITDELVGAASGRVLAGIQLGCISPRPAWIQ